MQSAIQQISAIGGGIEKQGVSYLAFGFAGFVYGTHSEGGCYETIEPLQGLQIQRTEYHF